MKRAVAQTLIVHLQIYYFQHLICMSFKHSVNINELNKQERNCITSDKHIRTCLLSNTLWLFPLSGYDLCRLLFLYDESTILSLKNLGFPFLFTYVTKMD